MLTITTKANQIFDQVIVNYHLKNTIDQESTNPFAIDSLEYLLYEKCWIDTIQWHVEDLIREPTIAPSLGMQYKRQIDKLNQQRTNLVEQIDDFYLAFFIDKTPLADAKLNTESPAWALDRLSILALKIYHMRLEAERSTVSAEQRADCGQKLEILLLQRKDLSQAIDELLLDIAEGRKQMKVYRQMKMYNDPNLNPILYANKEN